MCNRWWVRWEFVYIFEDFCCGRCWFEGVLARIGDQSFGFCRGKSVLDRLVLLVSLMGQWQLVLFGGKILSGFV